MTIRDYNKISNVIIIIGSFLIIIGCLIVLFVPKYINSKITEQTRLVNNSETFFKWKDPSLPIYIRYYIYNVSNPFEIEKYGDKPKLNEVGPILYQERRTKVVDEIDTENDTLIFRQSIEYFYRSDLSKVSPDDYVTVLNMPLVSIAKEGSKMGVTGGLIREAVHDYMDKNPGDVKLFVTRKLREILFEGYYDGLAKELSGLKGENILPNHTFAIYHGKNGTFGSKFKIRTGVKESNMFGEVVSVDGVTSMNHWEDEFCSKMNGSDGSIFPPFVTKDRVLRIFSEEACRSIYMTFKKEIDFHDVPVYRFHLPPQIWANIETNPDNFCFCSAEKCKISGLMDISNCKKGAPIFASAPHFLYGDKNLTNSSLPQMVPSVENDETYIDLEPNTGMLISAMKRFQVNIEVKRVKSIRGFGKLPSMIFPILWGEEFVSSTKETAEMIHKKLLNPMKIVSYAEWGFFLFGIIFFIIGSLIFFKSRKNRFAQSKKPAFSISLSERN